jgi:hypothetical protein
MSLTAEQQTSHLSRLQQEVLAWDYYRMGGEDDPGASGRRTVREVPNKFTSIQAGHPETFLALEHLEHL